MRISPGLQGIADIITLEKAMILAEEFGGTLIRVPRNGFPPDHRIRELLDPESVELLSNEYRSQMLSIPKGTSLKVSCRNKQILIDRATMSVNEIAIKYRLCERDVYRIVADELASCRC